jgi:hypothetical protein
MTAPGSALARRLPILAAAAIALASTGCGKLDRDAVQTEIEQVSSAAAEGALVAYEVERGRTLRSFAVIRTAELHKVAMNAAQDLQDSQTEDGLHDAAARGGQIGDEVRGLLERLHQRPTDRDVARHVRRELDRLSSEAGDLSDRL